MPTPPVSMDTRLQASLNVKSDASVRRSCSVYILCRGYRILRSRARLSSEGRMWAVGCGPPGLVLQVVVLVGMTVMVAMAVETILLVRVMRVSMSNGLMSVIVEAGSVISSVTLTAAGVTIMVEAEAVIVTI